MDQLSGNDPVVGVPEVNIELPESMNSESLRKTYIAMGGNPARKAYQAAEADARKSAAERKSGLDAENPFVNSSRSITQAFARIAVVFVQGILQIAMPLGLLLLLIAEGIAVVEGINILTDIISSTIYAAALMVFLITMSFIYQIVERSSDKPPELEFSLWTTLLRVCRIVGITKPENRIRNSTLKMVEGAMRTVSWTIILLGIFGRMKPLISVIPVTQPWYETFAEILTKSNFQQFGGYVSNLLIGLTMLAGVEVMVFLIHRAYVLATGGLDITSDNALDFLSPVSEQDLYEEELRVALRTQIYLLAAQKEKQRLASTTNALPAQLPEPSPVLLQQPIES